MAEKQKLITFDSIEKAEFYSEKQGISLQSETARYDLTDVIALAGRIKTSEDCRMLLNAWHFFSDLAKTFGEEFLGDSNEQQILNLYHKLFYGCNLKAMNQGEEEYTPDFDEDERERLADILRSGLSILLPWIPK